MDTRFTVASLAEQCGADLIFEFLSNGHAAVAP